VPNSNFFKLLELSETIRARKLIFRLRVNVDNVDKAMQTAADMTLPGRWYIEGPAKMRNPHINVPNIFCKVKFKFNVIYLLLPV